MGERLFTYKDLKGKISVNVVGYRCFTIGERENLYVREREYINQNMDGCAACQHLLHLMGQCDSGD